MGIEKRMNRKKVDAETVFLEGFLLLFVLSGMVGLPLIKLQLPFGVFKWVFLVVLLIVLPAIFILFSRKLKWSFNILFFILFFLLLCNYWIYIPDIKEDMTLEIIRTTIATNTMYQYNPATGRLLELGMYPVSKVITLPLVYSVFVDITGIDGEVFLYYIAPICILMVQFIVVLKWGKFLFQDNHKKRQLFLVFYAIVLFFGDYVSTTFSYRLLHMGWRGDTIVMGICLPYLTYCCVQIITNGIQTGTVISILLCIMTGIFVAPLAVSVGLQGLVLVVFILILFIRRRNIARNNETI